MSLDQQAMALYMAYPRKVARAAALKAIKKALRQESFESLIEAVLAYAESRKGQDKQYTPYPATWFNQERWADDREEWSPTEPEISTEEAWMLVRAAVRKHGVMGMPAAREVLPQCVSGAVEKVGWRNLCDMTEFNSEKLRSNFRVVYERIANGASEQDPEGTREGFGGGLGDVFRLSAGDTGGN